MTRTYWEMWSKVKPNKSGHGVKEGKKITRDQPMLAIYAERKAQLPKVIRRRPAAPISLIWSDTEQWVELFGGKEVQEWK